MGFTQVLLYGTLVVVPYQSYLPIPEAQTEHLVTNLEAIINNDDDDDEDDEAISHAGTLDSNESDGYLLTL